MKGFVHFRLKHYNIGNAGNATDPATGNLYGAVDYNYRIGKYEVTKAQWTAFVSIAGGAPTGNDGHYSYYNHPYNSSQPVDYISWYEAAQFCNFLTSGNKSKGAYQFSGTNSYPGWFLGINRAAAQAIYGTIYVLPTENEWYKAAYYRPDSSGYSLYANGTNTAPIAGVDAHYDYKPNSAPWYVGTGTQEQNGTYDMMGNVWEWNETLFYNSYRGICGGAYNNNAWLFESSTQMYLTPFADEHAISIGFRVAQIPEPATLVFLCVGVAMLRRNR